MVVSDNGSAFANEEFADFMARNGILPVRRPPRHPSSNGLVERSVRILKGRSRSWKDWEVRCTPDLVGSCWHVAQRLKQPAELLLNRRLRTRLGLLRHRVETQQGAQKVHHNNTRKSDNLQREIMFW